MISTRLADAFQEHLGPWEQRKEIVLDCERVAKELESGLESWLATHMHPAGVVQHHARVSIDQPNGESSHPMREHFELRRYSASQRESFQVVAAIRSRRSTSSGSIVT